MEETALIKLGEIYDGQDISICIPTKGTIDKHITNVLSFGGIITSVAHKITKTNKPYAMFSLEDTTDSQNFFIFGDIYTKCKHELLFGNVVYLEGVIKPETSFFAVTSIEPLKSEKRKYFYEII